MTSGDNQQETLLYYLVGFVDGEGSFNVSIRRHRDYRTNWKTSLTFNVSQKGRKVLDLLKKTLKCGYVRRRWDGIHYYEVVKFSDITKSIIPFFKKFRLKSEKEKDFEIFSKIAGLMTRKKHLTRNGIKLILRLREPMNKGGKNRRLKNKDILKEIK